MYNFLTIFQLDIKKTVINSLPTRDEPCMKTDYRDCVLEVVNENIQKRYGCIIPFLGNVDMLEVCSNNITLTIIKELKHVLQLKQYKNCIDNQPCNSVVYTILNPPSGSQKFTTGHLFHINCFLGFGCWPRNCCFSHNRDKSDSSAA